jgi:SAM-dependent methyltransferase
MEALQPLRGLFAERDVLDVGCHAGRLTVRIAHELPVRSVTAIDIDPSLILKAQEVQREYRRWAATGQRGDAAGGAGRAPVDVHWLCGDALSHSFPSRFHVVLCLHVAQHVHRSGGDAALAALLARLTSLLHAGGVLLLQAGRAGGRGDEAATGGALAQRLLGMGMELLHSLTVQKEDTAEVVCSSTNMQTAASAAAKTSRSSAPQQGLKRQRARSSRKRRKKSVKAAQGSRMLYVLQLPA